MKRKEALQLVSSLLDPATPMDEKQLAAARLSELIRILLPEEEKEEKMMLTILAISGIVTIGIGVIKTTKSFFWKVIWCVVVVFLFLIMVTPE